MNEEEAMEEYQKDIENTDNLLKEIKAICSESYYNDILEYLSEITIWSSSIVDTVSNKFLSNDKHYKWKEEGFEFKYVYGEQSCGYSGDDYSGEIYIPLPNGKYFRFYFCC